MRNLYRSLVRLLFEERWAVAIFSVIILILLAFYDWTLASCGGSIWNPDAGHYGQLAEGFAMGQVSLSILPDEVMLTAPDPYNPQYTNGHAVWDLVYFKGKYYLYYGAGPAVLLFYPSLLITGHPMGECMAMFIMETANLILFALLIRTMGRLQFRNCPLIWQAALLFVYGLCNVMPYLMRQIDMYQIAIVCGATAFMAACWFLFLGLHIQRGKLLCLTLASFCWGVAVASRPTYVFTAPFLFFVWLYLLRRYLRDRSLGKGFWVESGLLATPAALILLTIGWYNYARFGSPTEFGLKYCVAGVDYFFLKFFSFQYVPDRIWEYFFMPFQVRHHFPYMDPWPWTFPGVDPTRLACEHITGLIPSFPILLLALLWPFFIRRLYDQERKQKLLVYGSSVFSVFWLMTVSLLFFDAVTYRYLMDLTGSLFVLVALSLMAWRHVKPFSRWQTVLLTVLLIFSGYAGFAYSLVGDPFWIWRFYPPNP